MSVGVSQAISWRTAELGAVARSWESKAREVDAMARALRDNVERGTDRQSGEFIDRVRRDGEAHRKRAESAADLLLAGAAVLRRVEPDVTAAVTTLCRVVDDARDLGFLVGENGTVHDRRPPLGPLSVDAVARETRRVGLQTLAVDALRGLNEADDRANRELHGVVHREVRDRTDKGNWDPTSAYGAAAINTLTGIFGEAYNSAAEAGDIPTSPRWWNQARNFGLFGNVLGFVGGVASAPNDEPWYETLTAEGVGAIGGTVGSILGGPFTKPFRRVPGAGTLFEVGFGMGASILTTGLIRQEFDNAN